MLIPIEKTINSDMLFIAERMLFSIFLKNRTDIGRNAAITKKTKKTDEPRLMKTGNVREGMAEI